MEGVRALDAGEGVETLGTEAPDIEGDVGTFGIGTAPSDVVAIPVEGTSGDEVAEKEEGSVLVTDMGSFPV